MRRTQDGATPLHLAAEFNENPEVVTLLIKAGADVNAKDGNGFTPLYYAASFNENPEVVTAPHQGRGGCECEERGRRHAAPLGRRVQREPRGRHDPHQGRGGCECEERGRRHAAPRPPAYNENPEVVTLLIKAGADVNAKDTIGQTPLDWASDWKAEERRSPPRRRWQARQGPPLTGTAWSATARRSTRLRAQPLHV